MDKNVLSPYIRLAMHSVLAPSFAINERVLYDYEIIFVKEGKCRIRIDGCDYICKKNNVVFLRPGIQHSFHTFADVSFVQPHIHFDAVYRENSRNIPVSFKNRDAMSEDELNMIHDDVLADIDIPCVFTPENTIVFQNIFFRIVDSFSHDDDVKLKQKADMLMLIDCVVRQFETTNVKKAETFYTEANTIRDYIDSNFRQALTLDMLADIFDINKFTMMRKFKREFGINVMKYYYSKRISAAKHMLESTNLSVREIGDSLNFTDAYSFSRFFKEQTGSSPSKYRQNFVKI